MKKFNKIQEPRLTKKEQAARLLREVASGKELPLRQREWIKNHVVEDVLGVFSNLGMIANYDEMTAKWADMKTYGDFDKEAYQDLLELALNYYEELEDDYYSSRN